MIDLIPIGTINRTPSENNREKPSLDVSEVKQVERSSRVADQNPMGGVGLYRSKNRRRSRLERRKSRLEPGPVFNRRTRHDRRSSAAIPARQEPRRSDDRRGRYIDEEV